MEISLDEPQLIQRCQDQSLAAYFADGQSASNVTRAMQTFICTIANDMPDVFKGFVDYDTIATQVSFSRLDMAC